MVPTSKQNIHRTAVCVAKHSKNTGGQWVQNLAVFGTFPTLGARGPQKSRQLKNIRTAWGSSKQGMSWSTGGFPVPTRESLMFSHEPHRRTDD